jgi:hypothetical protein
MLTLSALSANIPGEGALLIPGVKTKHHSEGEPVDTDTLKQLSDLHNALVKTIRTNSMDKYQI